MLALSLPSAAAQAVTRGFPTYDVTFAQTSRPTAAPAALAFGHPADYRWEGLLIGAIGLGAFGAYVGNEFCSFSENRASNNCMLPTLEGLLLGAIVGGVTGGLIGGLFPRAKPTP